MIVMQEKGVVGKNCSLFSLCLQLALMADVNIRTLQQYEIGNKDLRKASADTIYRLSKVLSCPMEELILADEMV